MSTKSPPTSTDAAATTVATTTTIVEGSAQMVFSATEESTVFYNPVQVQNRDLSILMISLYSERRAQRLAQQRAKKQKHQAAAVANPTGTSSDQPQETAATTSQQPPQQQQPNGRDDDNNNNDDDEHDNGMTILEALAASGLRSIRYWNELPNVKHITINDMDAAAVERAHANIRTNGLQDCLVVPDDGSSSTMMWQRPPGIRIHHGDAVHEMYLSRRPQRTKWTTENAAIESRKQPQWDVIDVDPYGSAAPFLDAALQAVEHGGFLCITCTDMVALGGSHPETAFGRYASMPIPRAGYLHEVALRSLLYAVATTAARYGRTIRPILSVGMDFYVRIFVEVFNDKAAVNALSLKVGYAYQSTQCPSFHIVRAGQMGGKNGGAYQPGRTPAEVRCEETGAPFKVAGPIWLGPLHDRAVVAEALDKLESNSRNNAESLYPKIKWLATKDRLQGLLTSCLEELGEEAPLFYRIPDLAQAVKASSPPLQNFRAALINAGYKVSGFHKEAQAVKTDAPSRVVFDIVRAWCKRDPPKKVPPTDSAAAKILAKECSINVNFTIPASMRASMRTRSKHVARFPKNPQAFWGPKSKASGKRKAEDAQLPDNENDDLVE